ncbi:uncharacterized protein MONBRDRAFT_28576 [Monosiga brevicollis MX1]|uniref:Uncharacterized protein n=1 Tax=Monosiga brevicollis TaxID=81824 RepID=A9V8K6_MONBE|nr:uncharacterized protein MONBRDRAFT_28576 [Monosiga brevicollis MX1]EDQ86161.1 predicted protein [Monosiga brevicollis MX1]|eukprot:XP_001749086.1 hypothetical protein [Monosiga brevicollis MX1]
MAHGSSLPTAAVPWNGRHATSADGFIAGLYLDLDGTILDGDMHHACWYFLHQLPASLTKFLRLGTYPLALLLAMATQAVRGESAAVKILAWHATAGLKAPDLKLAGQRTSEVLARNIRPQVLAELRAYQAEGFYVGIVTGNLEPLVRSLVFDVLKANALEGTRLLINAKGIVTGRMACPSYPIIPRATGQIDGAVCVAEEKRRRLRGNPVLHELEYTIGYGNSGNDIPFMSLMTTAKAITPSARLWRHATQAGWPVYTPVALPSELALFARIYATV